MRKAEVSLRHHSSGAVHFVFETEFLIGPELDKQSRLFVAHPVITSSFLRECWGQNPGQHGS